MNSSQRSRQVTLNEYQTRQKIIDEQLRLAGWNPDDPSQVIQELDIFLSGGGLEAVAQPISEYDGRRFADYALLLEGRPAAVIEAKRTSKDARLGQEQALQYAQQIQEQYGGPIPFIFYTNGYETYYWESDLYPPARIHGFPTKEDLSWLQLRRESRKPLSVELINSDIAGRDYQIAAIRSVLEELERKRQKFLLVMATGTGKTRTATALFDVLIRARWAKRILFLVDRIALRNQALDAFKHHVPSEPRWPSSYKEREFAPNRRVYVNTYPTMLNLIQNGTTPETWVSPFFFDLIIADESHRSIYNIYKQVLDYFHGIKLGLTATPRDHIDHDTFKLFSCEQGVPTFGYSYEEAVSHEPPFLSDFEVLKVRSKFQIEGIKGEELSEAEKKRLIAEGKDIEEIDFEGSDLERKVTNSGTNALIIREFMEECIKDNTGTLPGKSIFFAITKAHARRLQDLFDALYPEHAGRLSRVIVSDDPRVYGKGGLLNQFKNANMPRVAISVDMLDTGVDIREVVNLVFAKPVYSYVKFWQMIGRGTRVLEEDPAQRKPWCMNKDKFLIIDCWGNFEFFEMHPPGIEPGTQTPLPVRLFNARLDKLEVALEVGRSDVVDRVSTSIREDLARLPQNNVVVMDSRADLAVVLPDEYWNRLNDEKLLFLGSQIAPVMRALSNVDFKAMRFETEVVDLGTALLSGNQDAFEAIRESIVSQVEELPLSVNVVAKERAFIEDVLTDHWWRIPSEEKQQELVDRLAPLMKFRQEPRKPMMILDLADITEVKERIPFGRDHEWLPIATYRERVEEYIRNLVAENPVLQKIQSGQSISEEEALELARLLETQDPHITLDGLRKAYDQRTAGFLRLIRHILGLEELEGWSTAVARAFDEFISDHTTLTSLQIRFLQTLRTFILQTGKIEKADLIEEPFTRIHPKGVRGVFTDKEIEEILALAASLTA